MTSLQERIAQFRKMANDDADNELGHFRLGQLLMEDNQLDEAIKSFRRTLELSPHFSKVYQLLGETLIKAQRVEDAANTLRQGFEVADERGDNIPRDEMAKLLTSLGLTPPASKKKATAAASDGPGGFKCSSPNCVAGARARPLAKAPINDDLGQKILANVCADCWEHWLKDLSIKVINEMRLDLSTEKSIEVYDQIMRETLGLT